MTKRGSAALNLNGKRASSRHREGPIGTAYTTVSVVPSDGALSECTISDGAMNLVVCGPSLPRRGPSFQKPSKPATVTGFVTSKSSGAMFARFDTVR
jgi:hypothetical protein